MHGSIDGLGGTLALDDVSFSLASGEIICPVGQSGCGKSSLLRDSSDLPKARCRLID
ncbi:ATP-binding cassette domain-containing protein [Sinorhizobium psoraleae]|uniref:ATP-binding cassette domain-containing protein n=1 Tax=Sinorhizobium psoraleae TaxID=520838 RepID=UPI0035E3D825